MSIRYIDADQNTLTAFRPNWDETNVGYVQCVVHEVPGQNVQPYPGGFSAVLRDMRIALPHCEQASYISLGYAYPNGGRGCSPRQSLAAESFEPGELNADYTIRWERTATRSKVLNLLRAELQWRKDVEDIRAVRIDDFPTPFDPAKLDFYTAIIADIDGFPIRLNASNLFYVSQTAGELERLAECCDGCNLEGEQLNEERKDIKKFNYRLGVLAERQSAITICAPGSCDTKDKYDKWCETLVDDLAPVISTGKLFIGYPAYWKAPKWA